LPQFFGLDKAYSFLQCKACQENSCMILLSTP